jgi:hypothetical protein
VARRVTDVTSEIRAPRFIAVDALGPIALVSRESIAGIFGDGLVPRRVHDHESVGETFRHEGVPDIPAIGQVLSEFPEFRLTIGHGQPFFPIEGRWPHEHVPPLSEGARVFDSRTFRTRWLYHLVESSLESNMPV